MIQRIQSVYLFLSAVLAIATLFIPVYGEVSGQEDMIVMLAALVNAGLALIIISQFKDRMRQIAMCKILLFVSAFFVAIVAIKVFDGSNQLTVGTILPLLVNLFNLLALRAIRADERLVRESDRLR